MTCCGSITARSRRNCLLSHLAYGGVYELLGYHTGKASGKLRLYTGYIGDVREMKVTISKEPIVYPLQGFRL